jgi:hypothetical protein
MGIKASNLEKLKSNIDSCIALGYDEVYCLIDMDGKLQENQRTVSETKK